MEKETINSIMTVVLALIGVAIVAELVSNMAQTGKVLTAGGGAISQMLCTALSPLGVQCGSTLTDVKSTIRYGGF
jgi:hypothetical protein